MDQGSSLQSMVPEVMVMLCMVTVVMTSLPFEFRGGNESWVQSYGNVSSHQMTFLSSTDRTHSPVIVYSPVYPRS